MQHKNINTRKEKIELLESIAKGTVNPKDLLKPDLSALTVDELNRLLSINRKYKNYKSPERDIVIDWADREFLRSLTTKAYSK